MEARKPTASDVELAIDEVQAALQILDREVGRRQAERTRFMLVAALFACATFMCYSCPPGLLVVWSNKAVGCAFLAVAAFGVIGILAIVQIAISLHLPLVPEDPLDDSSGDMLAVVRRLLIGRGVRYSAALIGAGFAVLTYSAGCGWLLYDLIGRHELNPYSIGLIAASIIVLAIGMGIATALDAIYLERVEELKIAMDGRLARAGVEGLAEISFSAKEYGVLSQAEKQQTRHRLSEVESDLPRLQKEACALVVSRDVQDTMSTLPAATQAALNQALFERQFDPRQADAQPVPGLSNGYTINLGDCSITFVRDLERNRVTVIGLATPIPGEEVDDAT